MPGVVHRETQSLPSWSLYTDREGRKEQISRLRNKITVDGYY